MIKIGRIPVMSKSVPVSGASPSVPVQVPEYDCGIFRNLKNNFQQIFHKD